MLATALELPTPVRLVRGVPMTALFFMWQYCYSTSTDSLLWSNAALSLAIVLENRGVEEARQTRQVLLLFHAMLKRIARVKEEAGRLDKAWRALHRAMGKVVASLDMSSYVFFTYPELFHTSLRLVETIGVSVYADPAVASALSALQTCVRNLEDWTDTLVRHLREKICQSAAAFRLCGLAIRETKSFRQLRAWDYLLEKAGYNLCSVLEAAHTWLSKDHDMVISLLPEIALHVEANLESLRPTAEAAEAEALTEAAADHQRRQQRGADKKKKKKQLAKRALKGEYC